MSDDRTIQTGGIEQGVPDHPDTIPAPPADPLIGTLIGERYLLTELLGVGGMGHIYRAKHVLMGKFMAVKLIHAELAHLDEMAKRFEREARSSSRLNSPHCISVTDFGRTDRNQLYLAMELLEGEDLDQRLEREGPIAPPAALKITAQILKGLAHAHEQGVIHRDLKPENIFLTRQGEEADFVKILDFGIAKLIAESDGGDNLTKTGMVFGTPKYLSPEQALGDRLDHRADLYAVGIILFEMLTGKPPFAAETAMDTLSMHLTAPLPKLSDHGAFPGSLQRIINRAMAKKPDDRFADAQAFLAAVEAVDLRENSEITIVIPKLVPDAARLAQWKSGIRQFLWSTRRRQGLTILAAIAVAAIVIFSVVRLSGDDAAGRKNPTPDRVATPQKPDRPVTAAQRELDTLLETAQTALTDRRYDDASTAARQALNLDKDNAAAMVALGHALFATSKQIGAVYQYQGAIEIDAAQATDERLRSNLMDALLYDETRNRAALLLARYGTEADLTRLADICNSKLTNGEVRRAVRMALEKTGHMDRIDWFETLTADFHEMKGCKERNLLIGQMLEKGDPRFIPFLEEFRPRAKKQANGVTTTENACIKASVDYAIRRLSAPPAIPAAQKP